MDGIREFVGTVTKRKFAGGSKSEHLAVFLETSDGEFVLRRQGANPFADPELDKLVGKRIRCHGEVSDYLLIMSDWTEAGSS